MPNKPSERLSEIIYELWRQRGSYGNPEDLRPMAITKYLDEQAEAKDADTQTK